MTPRIRHCAFWEINKNCHGREGREQLFREETILLGMMPHNSLSACETITGTVQNDSEAGFLLLQEVAV